MRMPTPCPHSIQQWACMTCVKLATDYHQYQKPPLWCLVPCKYNIVIILPPDSDEDDCLPSSNSATNLILVQSSPLTQFPAFHDFTKLGTLPNKVTPASCKIFCRNNLSARGQIDFLCIFCPTMNMH